MKKLLTILAMMFLTPALASAATVTFAPTSVAVTAGQMVSVNVVVDPQGTAYTAKVALSFPPSLLSVSSFSQASGWMPLSQPGYDSVDNNSGSLVKTAGMTGGFSAPRTFGTVTFIARANGVATISVNGATQILNASNQNTFSGGGQSLINISAPVIYTPAPVSQPRNNPARNLMENKKSVSAVSTSPATTTTTLVATTTTTSTQELIASTQGAKSPMNILTVLIPLATFLAGLALGQKFKLL